MCGVKMWGCVLDLHGGWSECGDLALHSVGDAGEHRRAARHHRVRVQVFTNVHVALHYRVERRLVDTRRLHPQEGWLEHGLGAAEPLIPDRYHLFSE